MGSSAPPGAISRPVTSACTSAWGRTVRPGFWRSHGRAARCSESKTSKPIRCSWYANPRADRPWRVWLSGWARGGMARLAGSAGFFDQQVPENGAAGPIEHHSCRPLLEVVVFKFGYCLALHKDANDCTAALDRDLLLRPGNQVAHRRIDPSREIPRAGLEVIFLDQFERELARTRGSDDNGVVAAIIKMENQASRDRQISGPSGGLQLDADRSIQVREPGALATTTPATGSALPRSPTGPTPVAGEKGEKELPCPDASCFVLTIWYVPDA